MDTKWKNRKSVVSFMVFVLGVSLVLGNAIYFLQNWSHRLSPGQLGKMLEGEDYQSRGRFRGYISNRLELFLDMATDSLGFGGYGYSYDGSYYGDGGYGTSDYDAMLNDILMNQVTEEAKAVVGSEAIQEEVWPYWEDWNERWYWEYDTDWDTDGSDGNRKALTPEKRKELARKAAEQYHDLIKGDANLLYKVSYDGKELYTNSGELMVSADGILSAPEGYNFLLYYKDGKVRIWKDGQELDVYGDGYYRDGTMGNGSSDWYVPGYRNFQVDEKMKKAEICMAVAREPLLYTEGTYGRGGYLQKDNSLYWMQYNAVAERQNVIRCLGGLAAGLALLLLAFLVRKGKRQADQGIARLQAKIWVECKVVLLFGILYALFYQFIHVYGSDLWLEFAYAYEYDYMSLLDSWYGGELLRRFPSGFWVLLFWTVYLVGNDIRYNKKPWKKSLAAKLYQTFSDRELKRPLSRRMVHRNALSFGVAVAYGVLLLFGAAWAFRNGHGSAWMVGLVIIMGMTAFLVVEYLIGTKNVEVARDVEALSDRIDDIRSGNYGTRAGSDSNVEDGRDAGKDASQAGQGAALYVGHDLETVMARLEDIRYGMAKAVDEQMKSERMKVELIANVSHDIKTPLTSIISYVEFLKEEENLPDHVKDYVAILDEKAQRLKNMVQDVFAVSKAASGELPVHMEELDFGKLLRQTLADMEEQIAGSRVSFRTELPDTPVMIRADGQRLYRVFQNLFQNALQYSLDGSRVHVTLQTDGKLAVASVKNTSSMEIEGGKDFTERFARGDASRTDGGSGLGMSIAQSFTEACGGQFCWETNADLFVVTVSFRVLQLFS